MRFFNKIFFVALVALCSCSGLNEVKIEEVRNVSIRPSDRALIVTLDARVNNPSGRKLNITELMLNVERNDAIFATISSTQKVVIPRRSNEFHQVPLELTINNMLGAIMLMRQKNGLDELMVEGQIKVKAFPMCKTIKVEKQSVKEFAAQYGDIITPLFNSYKK